MVHDIMFVARIFFFKKVKRRTEKKVILRLLKNRGFKVNSKRIMKKAVPNSLFGIEVVNLGFRGSEALFLNRKKKEDYENIFQDQKSVRKTLRLQRQK